MVATIFKRFALVVMVLGTFLSLGCREEGKSQPVSATREAFNSCVNRLRAYGAEFNCYEVRTWQTCSLNQYLNGQCGYTGSYYNPYYPQNNTALLDSYFTSYLNQFPAYEQQEMIRMWRYAY
jgi:hypothetical protein